MLAVITLLIVFFGVVNLIRQTMFIVGSDLYAYKQTKSRTKAKKAILPYISIIIPAHNEEKTILRAVRSIVRNKYPKYKREIIVVDDGSADKTAEIIKHYRKAYQVKNLVIVEQKQLGKAHALNKGIINHATGELIMCLDSDSYLASDGLRKAVTYFKDEKVVAMAANVKIIPTASLLNLIQRFEYIISYQMKRAQTYFNIEYIIGGIGSTFRKKALETVGYYDGDTVTEDIDLTMKLVQLGNKDNRLIYGADVVAYTESVLNISGLLRQRYRWKWGRSQTFLKNLNLFFNSDKRFTKSLTFVYLPFAIFSDIAFLLEPVFVTFIFIIVIVYGSVFTLFTTVFVISAYIILNILLEPTINTTDKIRYSLLAPSMYIFFYLLSFVEYVALIRALVNLPSLRESISKGVCSWEHVARAKLRQN